MAGSHVEEGGEQVRGKDSGPSTRGRKDKSRDAISSLEGRLVKARVGCGRHQGGDGFFGAKHGEGRGGSQGTDPRPSRGDAKLVDSCGVTRGVHDFSRQRLDYAR